ncbi:unnamed protein product [Bursaphelenchus okinawaensis]|uniref:Uncharacterized protein n=1 Tax=Bursaphelenchus okinawaensis TaxID=465554 RepID=A0A811LVZ0_9BILA|nr:unnamed protein product [Bursaphelenchus okinawaensis]CAG9128576.1 unnamed protein product [Bursaphelenchus okinawaensis]
MKVISMTINVYKRVYNFFKTDQQAQINGAENFIWAHKGFYEHMGITLFPHGSRPSSSNSERSRYRSRLSSSTSF